MFSALLRPLMLTAGLLLLLPPGWCCLLANITQPPVTTARAKPACCGHCGSEHRKSSAPASDHIPGRDGKCPCGERTANSPGAPVNAGLDLSLFAPITFTANVTAASTVAAYAMATAQFDPPNYHVLNCVWLC